MGYKEVSNNRKVKIEKPNGQIKCQDNHIHDSPPFLLNHISLLGMYKFDLMSWVGIKN